MMQARRSVSITPPVARSTNLSKGQKTFNDLVQRIGKQRERLVAWEAATSRYQHKYSTDLVPALARLADLQLELVRTLDRRSCDGEIRKADLRLIDELIVELAGPLLVDSADPDLKAIFNSHSDHARDELDQDAMDEMKAKVEDAFGIEAGTLDDVMEAADEELVERSRQRDAERQAHADARAQKKSPKQRAREARREADAQGVSQSIREVYRRLASALHPDRETDLDERKRKTALMQRLNAAYASNNLLQLLELQLELEHIDQAALDNISAERLQHYNTVLKQQLAELSVEIQGMEMEFRARFDLPLTQAISPRTVFRELMSYLSAVNHEIGRFERDVRACASAEGCRQFLARARRERKAAAMPF